MARLGRVAHQVIWVNPLKASPGYAPLARGMAAALPHVDAFVEGHSVDSLERLAAVIAGACPRASRLRRLRAVREILDDLERWRRQDKRVAVARVVDVEGSGPRLPGAAMAVNEDGEVAGSVSGGCVEGAVVAEALDIIETGDRRIVTFGYSDDEAFAVGLDVRRHHPPVHRTPRLVSARSSTSLRATIAAEEPVALATVVEGPTRRAPRCWCDPARRPSARSAIPTSIGWSSATRWASWRPAPPASVTTARMGRPTRREVSVFIESFAPPPQLLIFGAVDFTGALARVGKVLGYRVTVCDAREVFATKARFPFADEVVVDWPHRLLDRVGPTLGPRDAVCVLTHDPKFDVPAVRAALETDVGYLGAMGSRRTTDDRNRRLRDEGVTDDQLARVMAPIGLDLGARTPEETAVSIMAEIIASRTGRAAPSLRDSYGAIH